MEEQEEITWCDGYEQGICEGCDLSDKWLYEQKSKSIMILSV